MEIELVVDEEKSIFIVYLYGSCSYFLHRNMTKVLTNSFFCVTYLFTIYLKEAAMGFKTTQRNDPCTVVALSLEALCQKIVFRNYSSTLKENKRLIVSY